MEELLKKLDAIERKLTAIEGTLQRLPEVQAAVFLMMQEEAQDARFQCERVSSLWEVAPPSQR